MKKVFFLSFVIFLFGCKINEGTRGWYVDNKTSQIIDVVFDGETHQVPANTTTFIQDIPVNAEVSISDNYHVNYEVSYYYSTSQSNAKKLLIKDKLKFQYLITNNTAVNISFEFLGEQKTVNASGGTITLTCYDKPEVFTFAANNVNYNYTMTVINGIYNIVIQ